VREDEARERRQVVLAKAVGQRLDLVVRRDERDEAAELAPALDGRQRGEPVV